MATINFTLRFKLKNKTLIKEKQKPKEWECKWIKIIIHCQLELKIEIKNNSTFIKGLMKKKKKL